MNKSEFIAKIAPFAIQDMQNTNVAASLTIAQAALESAWGCSGLTEKGNNLFGIKGSGTAGSCTMQTTEYVNGKPIKVDAAFRAYHSWGESINDHSKLIINGVSWNRNLYKGVIGKRGADAARAIAAAGYATDPKYAEKLISIMNEWKLYQYDNKEGEQPMTATERKDFEELKSTIEQQAKWIKEQKELSSMPCPSWAKDAYNYYKPYIADEKGSYDFWRQLVINYRKENGITVEK